jgi:hypothetical protein
MNYFLCIAEGAIQHSHRRGNLKAYMNITFSEDHEALDVVDIMSE